MNQLNNFESIVDKLHVHYQWLEARKMEMGMIFLVFAGIVFDALKIWAAVSLNNRKHWARIFYLIYFLIVGLLLLVAVTVLSVMIYFGKGLSEQQNVHTTGSILIWTVLIIISLQVLFYFFGLFTLSSVRVKEEFSL